MPETETQKHGEPPPPIPKPWLDAWADRYRHTWVGKALAFLGFGSKVLVLLSAGMLLVASPAHAGTARYHPHTFTISTADCPSGTPGYDTDGAEYGISLATVRAWKVVLCAATGQTITGAGTLKACVWVPSPWGPGKWVASPEFDVDMTGKTSGTAQCLTLSDVEVGVGLADRLYIYPSTTFGVSGGTTLSVYLYGETR